MMQRHFTSITAFAKEAPNLPNPAWSQAMKR